jgi:hypothetical protein
VIVSRRQRNSTVNQKYDCSFECFLSYKSVSRGSQEKAYLLTVKNLSYNYDIHLNPFGFKMHEKATEEYQRQAVSAIKFRTVAVPYLVHRRVLDRAEFGLIIDRRTYYNLVRNEHGDKKQDRTISGLLIALDEAGFRYRTKVEVEMDTFEKSVTRKLVQIVFCYPDAKHLAQRFCAGKLFFVDGTFNTNSKRML